MRTLTILYVVAVACGGGSAYRCSDPQAEAIGIEWELLSGRVAVSRWEQDYPLPETHGCIYLIDAAARQVSVLRDVRTVPDVGGAPIGWVKDLAFRADGSTLTFAVQGQNGRWQLHDLSLETGRESVLFLDPSAHHFAPAWSPGGRIAYVSNGLLSADIYVDAEPVQSYAAQSRVAWLSNDTFVASIADQTSAGTLYTIDLARQWMTAIVPGYSASPAVDSGRRWLAYEHPDAEGWSLWVASVDGTSPKRITRGYSDLNAAWSADGESILFNRYGQGLFMYNVANGTLTQVTKRAVDYMAWAP